MSEYSLLLAAVSLLPLIEIITCVLGQFYIYDVWNEPPTTTPGWSNPCSSVCGGQTIMGGNGCFTTGGSITKIYAITIAHTAVEIQFDAYYIDDWEGESLILLVDGNTGLSQTKGSSVIDECGGSAPDYIDTFTTGNIPHNTAGLTLEFTTSTNQGDADEFWGFKNIKITVWPACDPSCATCFGNSNSECYSCNDGWFLLGNACVTDCGGNYWNNGIAHECSRNYYLYLLILKYPFASSSV